MFKHLAMGPFRLQRLADEQCIRLDIATMSRETFAVMTLHELETLRDLVTGALVAIKADDAASAA